MIIFIDYNLEYWKLNWLKIWKNQTYSPTIPVISEKWAKGNSQSHSFILLPTSSIAFAAGIGRRLGGKIVAMFFEWGFFYSCYRFHEISSFSYFNIYICWFLFPVVKKFLTVISFKKFSFWIELLIYWNNRGEGFFFLKIILFTFFRLKLLKHAAPILNAPRNVDISGISNEVAKNRNRGNQKKIASTNIHKHQIGSGNFFFVFWRQHSSTKMFFQIFQFQETTQFP